MRGRKQKYYAISVGRNAPMICLTWDECKTKVTRYPGSEFKAFSSRQDAEEWLSTRRATRSVTLQLHNESLEQVSSKSLCPKSSSHPTEPPPENNIVLSRDQQRILDRVKQGSSVFFTGSAGTGKSILLRAIINHFGGKFSTTLAITASTGIAAVNISGCTLHSWAGIGLGEQSATALAGKFIHQMKYEPVKIRWETVETLIIDEISMIDGKLFDKLEILARLMRRNHSPFGGIQLVLSGDFCQLPPVPGRNSRGDEIPIVFAFEAESWNRCVGQPMSLTQVFRQKDQTFINMLNAIRFGKTNGEITKSFRGLSRTVMYEDGIEPTELFPTRSEVEYANTARLRQLSDQAHVYDATDVPGLDSDGQQVTVVRMERLLDRMVAQKSLALKIGAQVMLIKNLIQGVLVNGSLGKVIDFRPLERSDEVHERSAYIPPGDSWPIVKFTNGMEKAITPVDFTMNNANGEAEAQRSQVPLILAYALSVHKSQGQTLERLKVDLRRTFEKGQAYVALSRATAMERLQVLNFNPAKIAAHPRVLEWYGITEDLHDDLDEMDNHDFMNIYYDS